MGEVQKCPIHFRRLKTRMPIVSFEGSFSSSLLKSIFRKDISYSSSRKALMFARSVRGCDRLNASKE